MSDINVPQLKAFFEPHVKHLIPLLTKEGFDARHDELEEALFMHDYAPVRMTWRALVNKSVRTSSDMVDAFLRELDQ